MQTVTKWVAALSTAALLSGCGDTFGEQALMGGGAGVAAAAVTKGDLATGAIIGAVGNVAYCQQYPSRC
ncbi:hypothetical protein [Lentibacter sp. XHP0401]|uniref:hypothetical protein n=1 Tax=Lentibacter sp. XHP0401 TaxID=2984334 RepID=UPI0021E6FC95|nr:hypothetical protein [Lentibacter sp. XHP0401]MCV2891586.1 hypothetical protein [Lentibacter sp. XHP0401]